MQPGYFIFGIAPLALMGLFAFGTVLHAKKTKKTVWNEDLFGIVSAALAYYFISMGPHGALATNDWLPIGFLMVFGLPFILCIFVFTGFLFNIIKKNPYEIGFKKLLALLAYAAVILGSYNLDWIL